MTWLANVQGQDLGRVAAAVDKLLDGMRSAKFPAWKTTVVVRGQVESMKFFSFRMAWRSASSSPCCSCTCCWS